MKGMIASLLVAVLALGTAAVVAAEDGDSAATHKVLGEFAADTTSGDCQYAHGALKELFTEAGHEFYYVSLVTDKNSKALERCVTDYNVYDYPTLYFDGGYEVDLGAGSVPSAKAAYDASLGLCEARAVPDIDVDLKVEWLGSAKMSVCATVHNNESQMYEGYIRVYITEIESSMGWNDSAGNPYTFAFLDYAFEQDIDVFPNNAWGICVQWDGSLHGFGGITYDNIMVIAAVFNDTPHQGYSNPPNQNPFTAHYADETAAARPNSLSADNYALPETGGTVIYSLYGYPENAGKNYIMVGSVSGTEPGTPLPGGKATLPLNWDVFTNIIIQLINTPIFSDFMGTLDGNGTATATFNFPGASGTSGLFMYFAYALSGWEYVSNPIEIFIY